MEDDKRIEIKVKVEELWDSYLIKSEIAKKLESEYIFGPLGTNEHYKSSDLMDIVKEVQADKTELELKE